MASREELESKSKDELMEMARENDVEGRSSMSKGELVDALAGSSDEGKGAVERGEAVAVDEDRAEELEDHLATDEEAKEASDERLETVEEEAGEEAADLAAHEMDESGPLHTEAPHSRTMTGAVSEEHATEQQKILDDLPKDYHGPISEAGAVERAVEEPIEPHEVAEEDEAAVREARRGDPDESRDVVPGRGAAFSDSAVAGNPLTGRSFTQKAVFYTDGLSGGAESNLERAYEIPELLRSNDEEEREAGEESTSEAAKAEESEE